MLIVAATVQAQIPGSITKQGLRVELDDFTQMPATAGTVGGKGDHSPNATARINFFRESPDGRLWVNDLRGQIYTLDEAGAPQLFVDVDAANGGPSSIFPAMTTTGGLAAGLIGFEFHPEFESNGLMYTIHGERASNANATPHFSTVDQRTGFHPVNYHTVITEWELPDPDAGVWNEAAGARREVLRVGTTADSYFHPFGDIQFNPTSEPGDDDYGLMYVSGGDWGYINGAGAPQGSPTEGQPGQLQRTDTLAGTMIRIDPRSPSVTGGQAGLGDYTIPSDNPFVDGDPQTFDEIFAFGFRNGHRMAWDEDGTQYVSSVGHANIEEIERIVPGGNYGWALREGTFVNGNDIANGGNGDADRVFANNVPDALDVDFRGEEFLYPVAQYDHGDGNAIAGGFVYRGSAIPQLYGKFVFGDIVNGRLFAADADLMKTIDLTDPTTTADIEEIQLFVTDNQGSQTDVNLRGDILPGRVDLRYGVDAEGEIYILTKTDGAIRRLVGSAALRLLVDRGAGTVSLVNGSDTPVEIDGYSLLSQLGALDPSDGAWNSLSEQGQSGWDQAAPTANALSELNPLGSLTLTGGQSIDLGAIFKPVQLAFGENAEELVFEYTSPNGSQFNGAVVYTGEGLTNNLLLTVDPATGVATLVNASQFDVDVEGYTIHSESGSLLTADGDWASLQDQGETEWDEAGPTPFALSELVPEGVSTLEAGEAYNLGKILSTSGALDLRLEFLREGLAASQEGVVRYLLAGDYNNNGVVDAADFTVWRDSLGGSGVLADATGPDLAGVPDGVVDTHDYDYWVTHFGNTLPALAEAVPEPATAWLVGLLTLAWATQGRDRRPTK
ncbi:Glucose / Sorbosone dehydrogenase [Pseudobythopirellula maris]|uniref:Glucose / Sorbosone dehydrogenase n=1 Tax=Pseudobythopirellula maris TaxID=2527991 RepID=A0A5C5ZTS8_9BACT|nr:Glucose / Sorbosone dehydrogenase [Pseudobythopirellula maris]